MKLLLNTKDFDGKIGKSKKEVASLGDVGKAALGDFAGFLGKVTAAAGIAVGGMELFNKAMGSSQALSDAFGRNIEVMKVGLDNFVYSLATLDFTPLSNGLSDMAQKAREMYDAFDQLNNTMMSAGYVSAKVGAEYRTAITGARNKNLSFEERKAFLEIAKERNARLQEVQSVIAEDSKYALKSAIAARTGLDVSMVPSSAIEDALSLDTRWGRKGERASIERMYDEYKKGLNEITSRINSEYTTTMTTLRGDVITIRLKGYEEAMISATRAYKEANAELITQHELLMVEQDENLSSLYSVAQNAVAATNQIAEMSGSINEVTVSLENEIAAAKAAEEKAASVRRAIAEMRKAVYDAKGADGKIAAIGMPGVGKLPEKVQTLDIPNVWDSVLIENAEAKAAEFEKMSTSVDLLSGSFSQLGGAIGGTAGNMLAFVGSIGEAVGAIIPFISYLWAESVAHDANASAAAKEAAAKALSSYAGIPFAGLGLGLAAVSAIIATMQSIPKFAEGAIVTSATLGVFGEAGPEAVMPLDRLNDYVVPREVRVKGQITGRGKDLVVTIDNYNSIQKVKNGK